MVPDGLSEPIRKQHYPNKAGDEESDHRAALIDIAPEFRWLMRAGRRAVHPRAGAAILEGSIKIEAPIGGEQTNAQKKQIWIVHLLPEVCPMNLNNTLTAGRDLPKMRTPRGGPVEIV